MTWGVHRRKAETEKLDESKAMKIFYPRENLPKDIAHLEEGYYKISYQDWGRSVEFFTITEDYVGFTGEGTIYFLEAYMEDSVAPDSEPGYNDVDCTSCGDGGCPQCRPGWFI